jgi:hypothetical protein
MAGTGWKHSAVQQVSDFLIVLVVIQGVRNLTRLYSPPEWVPTVAPFTNWRVVKVRYL